MSVHPRAGLLAALACVLLPGALRAQTNPALDQAVHAATRTPALVARDGARHPLAELTFFGLQPNSNVVEIWPGGGYWSEILAPYLAAHGTYTAVLPEDGAHGSAAQKFRAKYAGQAAFARLHITTLGKEAADVAPPGTADFVLTFRNVHNWMNEGYADPAFAAFFRALKPGGILGVEEHRGLAAVPQDPTGNSGYVRQDYTVALAMKAGFVLVGSSEIDANPRDTKNWPQGVWTLPPTYALGAVDHAKYQAIGEADNFVLKFRKPQ